MVAAWWFKQFNLMVVTCKGIMLTILLPPVPITKLLARFASIIRYLDCLLMHWDFLNGSLKLNDLKGRKLTRSYLHRPIFIALCHAMLLQRSH